MSAPPRLAIVIPAFNEGRALASTLKTVREHAGAAGLPFTIVVVDDGSRDDTWEVLRGMTGDVPELRAVRLSRNFGKEGAIAAGLDVTQDADAAILMDADLQHPPALIPDMVRLWRTGMYDVVEAVKADRGREPLWQRLAARSFYRIARLLTGHDLQDASDFKLLDRRVLEAWRRFGEQATFFRGLIAWLGFRRGRVSFQVPDRQQGRSRWSLRSLSALAMHAVTSFSALPLQLVTVLGVVTLLLAAVVGIQALRLYYEGLALPGFTTVILLQLIIGGFLMMSLGIIGTYVARIYEEVKGRPRYVVQERIGGDASA